VDFHGWMMPLHYGSQIDEHHAVRTDAGMFDVSHMTIVDLRGSRTREFLRYLLANDVAKLKTPGKALYTGMLGDAAAMLKPRVDSEIANHLSYMESGIKGRSFFVGNDLTGADIQLLFVCEAAGARLEPYPELVKYRARMQDRPAYKRGIEKGGEYALMSR